MNNVIKPLSLIIFALPGAFSLGYIAVNRGEQTNALWIVVAAVYICIVANRYDGRYITNHVLRIEPTRMTPALRYNDGLNYVPTDKKILSGHHFAAITGGSWPVSWVSTCCSNGLLAWYAMDIGRRRLCWYRTGFRSAVCFCSP